MTIFIWIVRYSWTSDQWSGTDLNVVSEKSFFLSIFKLQSVPLLFIKFFIFFKYFWISILSYCINPLFSLGDLSYDCGGNNTQSLNSFLVFVPVFLFLIFPIDLSMTLTWRWSYWNLRWRTRVNKSKQSLQSIHDKNLLKYKTQIICRLQYDCKTGIQFHFSSISPWVVNLNFNYLLFSLG